MKFNFKVIIDCDRMIELIVLYKLYIEVFINYIFIAP